MTVGLQLLLNLELRCGKLVRFKVGSVHLFKAFAINSDAVMLIIGHRSTDAGIDAMGSVKRAIVFLDPFGRAVSRIEHPLMLSS